MSLTAHPVVLSLLAELAISSGQIIEKHWDADEKAENILQHYGPFTVQVHGQDGHLASFMEEGVDFYPENPRSKHVEAAILALKETMKSPMSVPVADQLEAVLALLDKAR